MRRQDNVGGFVTATHYVDDIIFQRIRAMGKSYRYTPDSTSTQAQHAIMTALELADRNRVRSRRADSS